MQGLRIGRSRVHIQAVSGNLFHCNCLFYPPHFLHDALSSISWLSLESKFQRWLERWLWWSVGGADSSFSPPHSHFKTSSYHKGLSKHQFLSPTLSFWFCQSGVETRMCVFNKFLGDADIEAQEPHFENHCRKSLHFHPGENAPLPLLHWAMPCTLQPVAVVHGHTHTLRRSNGIKLTVVPATLTSEFVLGVSTAMDLLAS